MERRKERKIITSIRAGFYCKWFVNQASNEKKMIFYNRKPGAKSRVFVIGLVTGIMNWYNLGRLLGILDFHHVNLGGRYPWLKKFIWRIDGI